MSDDVNINALVPKELHKKLKIQLLRDELTYKEWLIQQINDYVEEDH